MTNKIKAVILGHAVADAIGVPAEFRSRKELDDEPITDMVGHGTYNMPAGCWSDDTSMTLAALDSLAAGVLDFEDIMTQFVWWYRDADYTPTGVLFDIGGTCRRAILNYAQEHKKPLECGLTAPTANGNGSLMRILPFVLYADAEGKSISDVDFIHNASALTHAHSRAKIGCGIYSVIVRHLLANPCKDSVRTGIAEAEQIYRRNPEAKSYCRLFKTDFEKLPRQKINSSGYVVDTLEAAVWCLLTTDCYADCVLKAVNLGEDTDTTAAVAGGMAGALYGLNGIPQTWLDKLKRLDWIEAMCERAAANWKKPC